MKVNTQVRRFSIAVLVVAAMFAGMILAGGMGLSRHVAAQDTASIREAAPPAAVASTQPFDFARLADQVVPSVVSVFSTDIVEPDEQRRSMPVDPFEFFFGPHQRGQREGPAVRQSAGSGFFVTADGELLTNNHVIADADKIEVELMDGTRYKAEVIGRDPATDIAVVRVNDHDRTFPPLALGNSKQLRVGEWVMAVGNPLNMDHTVTVGVVSAKGRVLGLADSSFENFIQTDAAINFGNSGGPLVNIRGEVVGINTAINAGGQNLGFAVPVDTARRILPQLREHGSVVRGYLGAQVRNVSPEIQAAFSLPSRDGAFVEDVAEGHAGAKAGLEHGDTIVAMDGEAVQNTRELIDSISARRPGTKVKLDVIRDGKRVSLEVELEERPSGDDEPGEDSASTGDASARAGLTVRELTPQLRQAYRIGEDVEGVLITRVDPVSPAGEEGLLAGDVIQEANGSHLTTPHQLVDEIESVAKGGLLRLYVYRPRADRSFYVILRPRD